MLSPPFSGQLTCSQAACYDTAWLVDQLLCAESCGFLLSAKMYSTRMARSSQKTFMYASAILEASSIMSASSSLPMSVIGNASVKSALHTLVIGKGLYQHSVHRPAFFASACWEVAISFLQFLQMCLFMVSPPFL